MEKTLPKGWELKKLGEVCFKNTGTRDPAETTDGFFEYIDISSIDNITGVIKASQTIANKDAPNRARKIIRTNDVLVSTVRPNLNAVAIVPKNLDNQICSTGFCVLRPYPEISDYRYIYFLTRSKHFVGALTKKTQGASYPAVSDKDIFRFQIPLPPLPVQHKIVEILEEADNLRKLRQKADEKMKDLIPSLFVEMFGDPATNPKGWEIVELNRTSSFKRGPFGGSLKKEIFVKDGFKVYEQRNAIYNDFNIGEYYIYPKKYNEMIAFAVQPNDLIVSCSGTMGKVAIVPLDAPKGIINQALLKITPNQSLITSLYLKLILENKAIQFKYFRNTPGSAIQNVTSIGIIKKIKIPLPSLPLQQEFAERVKEIEEEKERQAEGKKKLDVLFNSLMQRAFTGELVA